MSKENEVSIEISFMKRFNLGNYQHKEYMVKLTGRQSQVEDQLANEQQKLTNYIAQLESIVEIANDANKLKARVEANSVQSTSGSGKMQEL